jgi:hypothetical protein
MSAGGLPSARSQGLREITGNNRQVIARHRTAGPGRAESAEIEGFWIYLLPASVPGKQKPPPAALIPIIEMTIRLIKHETIRTGSAILSLQQRRSNTSRSEPRQPGFHYA